MNPDHHHAGPADGQVMLVVHIALKPGTQAEAKVALERLTDATRHRDRGVVRFEVGIDPADDTRIVGYEIWESQAALDEHSAQEHTTTFKATIADLVLDPGHPLQAERWQPMRRESPATYATATAMGGPAPPAPAPPGFRSERLQLDDASMHYVIGGAGPLAVLVHGFPNTWYAWRDVMVELAREMTVCAVDLRGLGDSEAGERPSDVPTGADDLARLVDALDLGPAHVAGQDWGGSTAFAFAAAHPQAVRALAVIEAMPAGPWTDTEAATPWFVGFHQIPDLPEQLVDGRERVYLDWLFRAFSASPGVPTQAAAAEYIRAYERPGAMASAFERYRTIDRQIDHNTRHLHGKITTPTLAVGGERVFGAAVAENLRHGAENVEAVVLDGCGHYVSEERPAELSQLLRRFFAAATGS